MYLNQKLLLLHQQVLSKYYYTSATPQWPMLVPLQVNNAMCIITTVEIMWQVQYICTELAGSTQLWGKK